MYNLSSSWLSPLRGGIRGASLSLLLLFTSLSAFSQHEVQISFGSTNILDTYLSPEEYTGTELRFMASSLKTKGEWSNLFQHEAAFSGVENRSGDGSELAGMYRFRYGRMKAINVPVENLAVRVGGHATANVGFLYNLRNTNNPAQGRAGLQVGPIAQADYSFELFKQPFSLHYQASLPLVGIMFSPNYGQSYYEIFTRGNYDHNVVPTTIIATPSLRHTLTLDFTIAKKTFSIGYLGDYDQYKVNNLKYHNYTHGFVIGYKY